MALSDLQQYPWNLYQIENVENKVVFLTREAFNSDNILNISYKQEMRKSL